MYSIKPFTQISRGMFKDSPGKNGEGIATVITIKNFWFACTMINFIRATMVASDRVFISYINKIINDGDFVWKAILKFKKCHLIYPLFFLHRKYTKIFTSCQGIIPVINKKIYHFIYISIVGIDKSDFPYYLAKLEVETMIQKSGIPYSIQRATQFHNLVLFLIKSFKIANRSSIIVPEGMKFQTIDIRNVADKLVQLAGENPIGKLPELGGPQVLDIEDMTKIYLKSIKKEDIKIKLQQVESDFYNVFKSGINLCPQNARGNITWEDFLGN